MKKVLLFKDGKSILGTDGLMYIDGRYNLNSIKEEVKNHNKTLIKNFPHLVADAFVVCYDRLDYYDSNITKL